MIRTILLTPLQKFIRTGSKAGILLFSTTIVALVLANSTYANFYESLLQYKLGFSFENFEFNKPIILWINDGLMAIFFFLIGLELKRELLVGEINTLKKASFPLFAAIGGILVPIAFYYLLNDNPATAKGWGIPMATDIAFALAILSLLGNKVPLSLKVFLTAFAIIDDIAAVIVIAVFYSSNVDIILLLSGIAVVGFLAAIYNYINYNLEIGLVLAIITWFLFLKSGIHPTIAGVLLAFTIPLKRTLNQKEFVDTLNSISAEMIDKFNDDEDSSNLDILTNREIKSIDNLDELTTKAVPPLQHLEHRLHNLTAYVILPIFAFANAGVAINSGYSFNMDLIVDITTSLFLGKLIGVVLFSFLGLKLQLTELPDGLKFKHIIGIAAIAGIGFTMSIFIDYLAFAGDEQSIVSAKIGIIIGSLLSGIVGYLVLRFTNNH